jgi:hypothetical protein
MTDIEAAFMRFIESLPDESFAQVAAYIAKIGPGGIAMALRRSEAHQQIPCPRKGSGS